MTFSRNDTADASRKIGRIMIRKGDITDLALFLATMCVPAGMLIQLILGG